MGKYSRDNCDLAQSQINEIIRSEINNNILNLQNNNNSTAKNIITSKTTLSKSTETIEVKEIPVCTKKSAIYDNIFISNIFDDIAMHDSVSNWWLHVDEIDESDSSNPSSASMNNSASVIGSILTSQTGTQERLNNRLESSCLFRTLKKTFSYSTSNIKLPLFISCIFFFFFVIIFSIIFFSR